jgi:transcriptional regulator with XRE-family HTH domain
MEVNALLARIEQLCKARGINKTTAFKESGVGKNFASNLSTSNPSMQKLTALANYFNVSVAYLTGEEDDEAYARRVMGLVVEWLIDNDFSLEEDDNRNVTIEKNGKCLYLSNADFMIESLAIKKVSENGFELAMLDWVHRKFSPVTEHNFSKQELELVDIYRDLSLSQQIDLITHALKLKNGEK